MKRTFFYSLVIMGLVACEKQMDETAKGPKAKITIINAALDSDPVTLVLDGEKVNETGVAYGESTGTVENSYLPANPGVKSTRWEVGTTEPAQERLFHWLPDGYYTIIQYDTAIANKAPVLIVADNLVPNDTLAKVRFINCIAGDQKLSIRLINTSADTVKLPVNQPYMGISGSFLTEFSTSVPLDERRLELVDQDGQLLYQEQVTLSAKTCYSFVGFGEKGGTGDKAPKVKILAQVK